MPVWTEDDITALVSTDDLAESIYYFPSYGNADVIGVWAEGIAISAVFTDAFKAIDMLSSQVASSAPTLQIKSDEILTLMEADQFIVKGNKYKYTGIEPDGTGMTVLILTKA